MPDQPIGMVTDLPIRYREPFDPHVTGRQDSQRIPKLLSPYQIQSSPVGIGGFPVWEAGTPIHVRRLPVLM